MAQQEGERESNSDRMGLVSEPAERGSSPTLCTVLWEQSAEIEEQLQTLPLARAQLSALKKCADGMSRYRKLRAQRLSNERVNTGRRRQPPNSEPWPDLTGPEPPGRKWQAGNSQPKQHIMRPKKFALHLITVNVGRRCYRIGIGRCMSKYGETSAMSMYMTLQLVTQHLAMTVCL